MSDIKRYLTWDDAERLTLRLARIIKDAGRDYDVLLGVARGGTIPATLLAQVLEHGMVLTTHLRRYEKNRTDSDAMPEILAFPPTELLRGKRILLIDEVYDRGHSLNRALQEVLSCAPLAVDTAVLHFKPGRNKFPEFRPTFSAEETEDWVVYPWEQFADKLISSP